MQSGGTSVVVKALDHRNTPPGGLTQSVKSVNGKIRIFFNKIRMVCGCGKKGNAVKGRTITHLASASVAVLKLQRLGD